jgi:hypothetical protein
MRLPKLICRSNTKVSSLVLLAVLIMWLRFLYEEVSFVFEPLRIRLLGVPSLQGQAVHDGRIYGV